MIVSGRPDNPLFPEIRDLIDRAANMLGNLALHRVLAEFEPRTPSLRIHPAKVGAVTRKIRSTQDDEFALFASPKGRHDFLWAARNYLSNIKDHEELLVAFGRRRGRTRTAPSRIEGIWRGVGTRSNVRFRTYPTT